MICSGMFGVSTSVQIGDSSASLIHYKQSVGLKLDVEDCDNPMFPAQKEIDIH